MLQNPASKYHPFPPVELPDRRWPCGRIISPPIWCSTDLRDGNQALFEPMNRECKLRLFELLVAIGFRHIEVGFPAASQIDFDVVRALIETRAIPEHVTPMVLTQAREDLIGRSVESLRGATRAIVHVYNATSPLWRRVVFGLSTEPDGLWEVPYLPIDPHDVGRNYEGIIRINSQSGKGGIAYLLERDHGVVMPRRMQVEFSAIVQAQTDAAEKEMSTARLWELFEATYLRADAALQYQGHHLFEDGAEQGIEIEVLSFGTAHRLRGSGSGPIDATIAALGLPVRVDSYEERALGHGADAAAIALIEMAREGRPGTCFGVGRHRNIVTASILAILSAVRRLGVDSNVWPRTDPSIAGCNDRGQS